MPMNSIPKNHPELYLAIQRATRVPPMPDAKSIRLWISTSLTELCQINGNLPHSFELTIRIVGVREARHLNSEYRGKDYATNVLSFPYGESAGCLSGDLVIAARVVADEARQQCKPLTAHFAHLAIHGLLHVIGYDHESDAEALIMESLETRLLAKLGFPDPYLEPTRRPTATT